MRGVKMYKTKCREIIIWNMKEGKSEFKYSNVFAMFRVERLH